MRILIAEDDPASRLFLTKILQKYGQCDVAVNGIEAVDMLLSSIKEKDYYSLLCLDVMMPKMDGIKVLKTARQLEKQFNVPEEHQSKIVMTTGYNETELVNEAYEYGCEAFASKPLNVEKLLEVLKEMGLIP